MTDGRNADGDGPLATLRSTERYRWLLVAVGGLAGLALATVHWSGFVLGGALVALPQPSVRRGLLSGLRYGFVALVAFLGWLAVAGALGTYLAMGPVLGISAAVPVVGALFGALVRGVV